MSTTYLILGIITAIIHKETLMQSDISSPEKLLVAISINEKNERIIRALEYDEKPIAISEHDLVFFNNLINNSTIISHTQFFTELKNKNYI